MSPRVSSSGMLSSVQMLRSTLCSSLTAVSLDLYCSTGIVSGPAALPCFNFLTHSCTSRIVISGTVKSISVGSLRSTTGSLSHGENFASRNFAHSSSCCSELVMLFPWLSMDGWTKELPFWRVDSDFAFRWMSDILPSAMSLSISLKMSFT